MDRCDAAGSSLPPRRRQSTLSRTDLNSWQAGDDSDSGAQCSVDDRRPVTSPRPPRILVRSSPSFLSACAALSPRPRTTDEQSYLRVDDDGEGAV